MGNDAELLENRNLLFALTDPDCAYFGGRIAIISTSNILLDYKYSEEIKFEWNSKDHLIQDADPNAIGFGVVSDKPECINLNYIDYLKEGSYNGDIFLPYIEPKRVSPKPLNE